LITFRANLVTLIHELGDTTSNHQILKILILPAKLPRYKEANEEAKNV